MRQEQMITLGTLIVQILRQRGDDVALKELGTRVPELADGFPAYPADFPGHV
jgi:hypothetical protein